MGLLGALLVPRPAFVLLSGALGTETIDLGLAVSCAFLELSELLDLPFLLLSFTLFSHELGLLRRTLVPLVLENALLEFALILLLLLLQCQAVLIRLIHLTKHLTHHVSLDPSLLIFFLLLPLNIR